MNRDEIKAILARITFAPSCIDMGWEWQVDVVYGEYTDRRYWPVGFLIRTTFQRPDTNTGKVERGYGRWWHVPADASESAIVKTAFAACKLILEHELMEAFLYARGPSTAPIRVFDPHHDISDLEAAAESKFQRETGL